MIQKKSFIYSGRTISLLEEKTKGNLSAEEAHLLENVLYELRMKFLSKSKAIKL